MADQVRSNAFLRLELVPKSIRVHTLPDSPLINRHHMVVVIQAGGASTNEYDIFLSRKPHVLHSEREIILHISARFFV